MIEQCCRACVRHRTSIVFPCACWRSQFTPSRWDKSARNYLGMAAIAASCCWLRFKCPRLLVFAHDRSDVFAAQCRFQQMRLEPVDDLKLLDLAGVGKKIDQHAIKRQGRQITRLELSRCNVLDEGGFWVGPRVCFVEAIDIFDQRMVGAAVAFSEQKTPRVGAVRRDAAHPRRM